jgi:hypothetical protein
MNALLNVIRAELFKVVRKRRTYILAALWWVLLPAILLIVGRVVQVNVSGSFVEEDPRCATSCNSSPPPSASPGSA